MVAVAPASYVYGDALMRAAVVVADTRNKRLGHGDPPCEGGVDLYVYDDAPGFNTIARADIPGCRVYYNRGVRDAVWEQYREGRRDALWLVCKTAVHERLHNMGFTHTPTGIMAPFEDQQPVPAACKRWARRLLP